MAGVAVGDVVRYTDREGHTRPALVVRVFDVERNEDIMGAGVAVNLVTVAPLESMQDPHGRQLLREDSVPHRSGTTASGYFWDVV